MIFLKKRFFFSLSGLIVLTVMACSPRVAPNPTTPTPLPVIVQADTTQSAAAAVESNPKAKDTAREVTGEASPNIDDPAVEKEVVVDEEEMIQIVSKWTGIPLTRREDGEAKNINEEGWFLSEISAHDCQVLL